MKEIGKLKIAVPDGHLWEGTTELLRRAGYRLRTEERRYDVILINDPDIVMKIKRPQNIPSPVEKGVYDLGFTGYDLVIESGSDVEELADLGYGRADIVVAASKSYKVKTIDEFIKKVKGKTIWVGSEYPNITKKFLDSKLLPNDVKYTFELQYGKAESFEGDLLIENTETGHTLEINNWQMLYKILSSTARLIANKQSLEDSWKKEKISDFLTLIQGAQEGLNKRLLKMNVPEYALEGVISVLPALKKPTISKLYGKDGWVALESVVPTDQVVKLIPELKKKGAEGILETEIIKVIK